VATTILYTTNPKFWLPRQYIKGFVGSADVTNLAIVGNFLSFDYLAPLIHVDLRMKNQWQAPNSNNYTLDFIFDPALSQVYLSGSPIVAAVNVGFYPMTTENHWRIRVLSTFAPKETEKADLIPLSPWWVSP
jgi:hypothetical protein